MGYLALYPNNSCDGIFLNSTKYSQDCVLYFLFGNDYIVNNNLM